MHGKCTKNEGEIGKMRSTFGISFKPVAPLVEVSLAVDATLVGGRALEAKKQHEELHVRRQPELNLNVSVFGRDLIVAKGASH
jgi:hypothetical protein